MHHESAKPTPSHVGIYIREHVIPADVSVTKAAELLQIGRPALSNLLNGNASLSPEMATKLAEVFGADRSELLRRQAELDELELKENVSSISMGSYVPPFLLIKAQQIHQWSDKIEARQLLPVLLRRLIHSTGRDLRHVDFPGYDSSERKGWDGIVEIDATTPWIPEGRSYWQFGVNADPKAKAEQDYTSRPATKLGSERVKSSFVFFTSRIWDDKEKWAESKQATGVWKSVKAFDANDLEQWLEQSIPAQIWFAEKLSLPTNGVETLDLFWNRWKKASSPPLTCSVFTVPITAYIAMFKEWIEGKPGDRPFVVAADSTGEAIAFLACLLKHKDIPQHLKDNVAFFRSVQTLRELAGSSSEFIPIASSVETERELVSCLGRLHCIAVRPRNAVDSEPNISLGLLNHVSFTNALTDMGIEETRINQLARQTGRSVTILRRLLSNVPAVREPDWASDFESVKMLIPVALVGAWHADTKADREIINVLANRSYDEIERGVTKLSLLDDSPVWSIGRYFGIASKIDALFAISKYITAEDLKEFFWIAEYVLSERDPALDLPEESRWAAGLYDKMREHSGALREGIYETLTVLAVHGGTLLRNHLGNDVEGCVSALVNKLLSPFTLDKLLSHNHDLPRLAEAAPKEFLDLVEADLRKDQPELLGLLKPVSPSFPGYCPRTGLMWALECLGWKHIGRISRILANLSRTDIDDNWSPKPITSLKAIFRCWFPQTAASLEDRMNALTMLCKDYPDIGWQICISQLDNGPQIGEHNYRPRWRSDATGAGHSVENDEIQAFMEKAFTLATTRSEYDHTTLGDLVERSRHLPHDEQAIVWNLIERWVSKGQNDESKGYLRDQIRNTVLSSSGRRFFEDDMVEHASKVYTDLRPSDIVSQYTWLFADYYVELPDDELENDLQDFEKQQVRIRAYRLNAMADIWDECGFDGVYTILIGGGQPFIVGECLGDSLTKMESRVQFVSNCLSIHGDHEYKIRQCLLRFLSWIKRNVCAEIITKVAVNMDHDHVISLFQCAPFRTDIWRLLDSYDEDIRTRYWKEIIPTSHVLNAEEANEVVDNFLTARRPNEAFQTIRFKFKDVETGRLYRLLYALGTAGVSQSGNDRLNAHDVTEALESLDSRSGITTDQKAQLEFMFIDAIRMSKGRITNLELQFFDTPITFIQVLALAFHRKDKKPDPPEWVINDLEVRNRAAQDAFSVLGQIRGLPGMDSNSTIDEEVLISWINEVRRLCVLHGREEIGDYYIGKILANAPAGDDEIHPCLPVCDVMEKTASRKLGEGFMAGVEFPDGYVKVRWEGEIQKESEHIDRYREWSRVRSITHPFVSRLLEDIAKYYEGDVARWNIDMRTRERLDD